MLVICRCEKVIALFDSFVSVLGMGDFSDACRVYVIVVFLIFGHGTCRWRN
jgi:hypothetical protein